MKKIGAICFVLIILLINCSQIVNAAAANGSQEGLPKETEESAAVTSGCYSLDGKVPLIRREQVSSNMTAAFLYDPDLNTVLYSLNPDMPIYPTSLVKIMTALLAVEQGELTDQVTVKEYVLATVSANAASAHLQPNEVMSLENLLYCMMVGSANDAAAVIADHISGSQEAFVAEMNRKAEELGCTGTVFTNPHGLYEEGQVSTTRDIAKIVNYAMKNPQFMTFFAEEYYVVPETNMYGERSLYTNNYLMYSIDNMRIYRDYRTTGGRTGTDEAGRRCLATTAEENDRTLICVIMGAESVYDEEKKTTITFGGFTETSDLLTLGFESYAPMQVLYENQIFRQYPVLNGENDVVVGTAESAFLALPVDIKSTDISYRFFDEGNGISAPVEKGEKLSNVQVWYGNVCLADADLYAMGAVRVASAPAGGEGSQPISGIWKEIVVVIAAISGGLILVLLCIRLIGTLRFAAVRRRGRHYRKSHRRSR